MKKLLISLAIVMLALSFGCQKVEKRWKHTKSAYVGLNRVATLYDYNGKLVKQWKGKFMVETDSSGVVSFIDENNKEVKVSGGIFTVEEQ